MAHKEIDHISGTETTGHSWDGDLKELNTPLPSWWLWVFWISVIWSVGYYVAYPSWPTVNGYTQGMLGWSSRGDLEGAMASANAAMTPKFAELEKASMADIQGNAELGAFAAKAGKAVFGDNCVACHGTGADGVRDGSGYPNLTDGDWLWGGSFDDIARTIKVGIRSGHGEERSNVMAAYGDDGILDAAQIKNVAGYVLSLSGGSLEGADTAAGQQIFADNCVACHGPEGKGNVAEAPGAPNLTDNIWLFGKDNVEQSIAHGRAGVMPAWEGRLTPAQIKAAAVYVYTRGGGQ